MRVSCRKARARTLVGEVAPDPFTLSIEEFQTYVLPIGAAFWIVRYHYLESDHAVEIEGQKSTR